MTLIRQITTTQTGFTGAPGYTNMYFDVTHPIADQAGAVRTFWESIAQRMPSSWRYSINADVNILEDSTGAFSGAESVLVAVQAQLGESAAYAAPVGASATWDTAATHGSHRMKGRTFIVPLASGWFDTDGTINGTVLAQLQGAASALVASGTGFGVWGRPRAASVVNGVSRPALTGLWAVATGAAVRDRAAVLRSRRD